MINNIHTLSSMPIWLVRDNFNHTPVLLGSKIVRRCEGSREWCQQLVAAGSGGSECWQCGVCVCVVCVFMGLCCRYVCFMRVYVHVLCSSVCCVYCMCVCNCAGMRWQRVAPGERQGVLCIICAYARMNCGRICMWAYNKCRDLGSSRLIYLDLQLLMCNWRMCACIAGC